MKEPQAGTANGRLTLLGNARGAFGSADCGVRNHGLRQQRTKLLRPAAAMARSLRRNKTLCRRKEGFPMCGIAPMNAADFPRGIPFQNKGRVGLRRQETPPRGAAAVRRADWDENHYPKVLPPAKAGRSCSPGHRAGRQRSNRRGHDEQRAEPAGRWGMAGVAAGVTACAAPRCLFRPGARPG
jgi:hypothetical protein